MVIPTKNRSLFLCKLFKYHTQAGFKGVILIGDASDPIEQEKNRQLIQAYQKNLNIVYDPHPPQTSLIEGTNLLLAKAETPFSVLSGDDDFLVPQELARCVDFLENHSDYSCACGQQAYVFVRRLAHQGMEVERVTAGYSRNHESERPSDRLLEYVSHGRANNTFSVQKTDGMRARWQKASDMGLDTTKYHGCLHEVSVNVASLIHGRQRKFPGLYHAMLRHDERIETTSVSWDLRWLERMCTWNWSNEILQMIRWWTTELMAAENLEQKKAYDIAEVIFLAWIASFILDCRNDLLKKNRLSLPYQKGSKEFVLEQLKKIVWLKKGWDSFRNRGRRPLTEHKDFLPIQEILLEPL